MDLMKSKDVFSGGEAFTSWLRMGVWLLSPLWSCTDDPKDLPDKVAALRHDLKMQLSFIDLLLKPLDEDSEDWEDARQLLCSLLAALENWTVRTMGVPLPIDEKKHLFSPEDSKYWLHPDTIDPLKAEEARKNREVWMQDKAKEIADLKKGIEEKMSEGKPLEQALEEVERERERARQATGALN